MNFASYIELRQKKPRRSSKISFIVENIHIQWKYQNYWSLFCRHYYHPKYCYINTHFLYWCKIFKMTCQNIYELLKNISRSWNKKGSSHLVSFDAQTEMKITHGITKVFLSKVGCFKTSLCYFKNSFSSLRNWKRANSR